MSDQLFTPVINERTPSRTHYAEIFLSPGPDAIGATGQNRLQDFIGQEWVLLLDEETRELQLWRLNGTWYRVPAPGHPLIDGVAPEGARRFTLCFDQAARPTVAYELDGIIRVTRWDPTMQQYISNVSFPGHDPALQLDAVWSGDIPDSDVLLFYLTPDRTGVRARVQRELYLVGNVIWDYDAPVILDRVVPAPIRYQVLVSRADGRALPDVLVSDPYPYAAEDALAASGVGPQAGVYTWVVIPYEADHALTATGAGPSGGSYDEPIINYDAVVDALASFGTGPSGGVYEAVIIEYAASPDELVVAGAGPNSGVYFQVVINALPATDEIIVSGTGPSGGSYDTA